MGKRDKSHDLTSFGGRLRFYRERLHLSQAELGEMIFTTRQNVSAWEKGERSNYAPYISALSKALGVDETTLITGLSEENQTIASDLGLCNAAIAELKRMKKFSEGEHSAIIEVDEMFSGEVDTEGFSPEENLQMINLLLSTGQGLELLSLLYRYCYVDFSSSYMKNERGEEKPIDELMFYNRNEPQGKTIVSTSLMRYSLLKGIENLLEEMADNMKGDRK